MISKLSFLSIHFVTICLVGVLVVTFFPGTGTATSGLVSEWHFDGNIQDYSENGNHGTNNGAVFVQGISGQALSFDGVDDYIIIGQSDMFKYIEQFFVEISKTCTPILIIDELQVIGDFKIDGFKNFEREELVQYYKVNKEKIFLVERNVLFIDSTQRTIKSQSKLNLLAIREVVRNA